jgi:hypothetical protein
MSEAKYIFIFLILFVAAPFTLAQEKSGAALIDEIGALPYDHLRGRIDNFLLAIKNDVDSTGYVIIYGDKTAPIAGYQYEILLKNHLAFRRFPGKRVIFLHGKDEAQIRAQFWKTPRGTEPPVSGARVSNYKLTSPVKPFLAHKNSWLVEDGFETFSLEFYSLLLKSNPDLRGNLVIYGKSLKDFRRTRNRLATDLTSRRKVSPKQLRFFYVKGGKTDIEFWLVPKTTK